MSVAFQMVFNIQDEANKDATFSLFVPTTFDISDYVECAIGIGEFIDIILHGRFKSIAELGITVDISSLTGNVAELTSDVEEIGAFQFETTEGRPVDVNIPCLDESVVLTGTKELDQSAPAVAGIIALMETGVTTAGGQVLPCDVGEIDVNNTVYARERSRNSGRAV